MKWKNPKTVCIFKHEEPIYRVTSCTFRIHERSPFEASAGLSKNIYFSWLFLLLFFFFFLGAAGPRRERRTKFGENDEWNLPGARWENLCALRRWRGGGERPPRGEALYQQKQKRSRKRNSWNCACPAKGQRHTRGIPIAEVRVHEMLLLDIRFTCNSEQIAIQWFWRPQNNTRITVRTYCRVGQCGESVCWFVARLLRQITIDKFSRRFCNASQARVGTRWSLRQPPILSVRFPTQHGDFGLSQQISAASECCGDRFVWCMANHPRDSRSVRAISGPDHDRVARTFSGQHDNGQQAPEEETCVAPHDNDRSFAKKPSRLIVGAFGASREVAEKLTTKWRNRQ